KIKDAGFTEAADAAASLQEIPQIFGSGMIDRGRRDGSQLREEASGGFQRLRELRVFRGVFRGEATNSSSGLGRVIIEKKCAAIRRGSENTRIGPQDFATELFELQIFRNIRAKRTEGVRKGRSVKAGMKFLGDGAAADHFAAFEDEWLE